MTTAATVADAGGRAGIASFSLVIPAHNEAPNIGAVVAGSRDVLRGLTPDYEIVLVDDGSTDSTVAVATAALGADAERLVVVRHENQMGYGVTVCDGLRAASRAVLGFIDGDGQFDPTDLRTLAERLGDADLVTGRRSRRADPAYRSVVSGVFNLCIRRLYGIRLPDVDCGLKVMRREVFVAACPIVARSAVFNSEIYYKARRCGFRLEQVGVHHYPRLAGRRSGGRMIPIARAIRDLVRLRVGLRRWEPPLVRRV